MPGKRGTLSPWSATDEGEVMGFGMVRRSRVSAWAGLEADPEDEDLLDDPEDEDLDEDDLDLDDDDLDEEDDEDSDDDLIDLDDEFDEPEEDARPQHPGKYEE
jgi:hypothetical protein